MSSQSDEHRMLQDSLESMISAQTSAECATLWPELAAMGMLGLALPESTGGVGLGLDELMLVSEIFGKAGAVTPFIATEGMALPLLAQTPSPRVSEILPKLTSGEATATVALNSSVTAVKSAAGYTLSGTLTQVPAGAVAGFIVALVAFENGPSLVLLDATNKGLQCAPYLPDTQNSGADFQLDEVQINSDAILASGETAAQLAASAAAYARILTCADMIGAMSAMLEQTSEYLRTRNQFGRPLAAFQALQHAAVDMYVELETARALLDYARRMFFADAALRDPALDAAKLKVNRAAKLVSETAVQLHGGIGMTLESLTGQLFARITAARVSFGDERACLNRLIKHNASIALS